MRRGGEDATRGSFLSSYAVAGSTEGKDGESTRQWRNANIADYLKVGYETEEQLARVLSGAFPSLNESAALLRMNTGITFYHSPLRPATIEFVERHAGSRH